ncbi:hypothetical protein JTE90_011508 [Oedothorax gibbosus]|uniref:Uncharacterized protein n=1 Tax=Oedothorax gibbosus TaxID=931172 RepID=A0AAV6TGQ2_9ARAC|nr:hypothetical protein JTE90_011508 [Oedothorax gibbosus]
MGHSVCAPRVQLVDHSVCLVPGLLPSRLSFSARGSCPVRAAPSRNYFMWEILGHIVIVDRAAGGVKFLMPCACTSRLSSFSTLGVFLAPPQYASAGRVKSRTVCRGATFRILFMAIFPGVWQNTGAL